MKLALAGDTMLGRGVGEVLLEQPPEALVDEEVAKLLRGADLCVINLECCISSRGSRWPDPNKRFFFRAPPAALALLRHLGVDCVTLANNHALDFGAEALLDTLETLEEAGIAAAGAGPDLARARRPAQLTAAGELVSAGASLVAGHSAHIFHGVQDRVLYDLGDFVDDYATDPVLRNDLGLLFLVTLDARGPQRIEAVPLRLEYAHTRLADGDEAVWIEGRFRAACAALGSEVTREVGRLVVSSRAPA